MEVEDQNGKKANQGTKAGSGAFSPEELAQRLAEQSRQACQNILRRYAALQKRVRRLADKSAEDPSAAG